MIKIKYKLEKLVAIVSIVFLTFLIFLTIFSHTLLINQHANFESECKKIIEKFYLYIRKSNFEKFYTKVSEFENFIKNVEKSNSFMTFINSKCILANIFAVFLSISYIFLSFLNKSSIKIENKICRRAAFFLVPLVLICNTHISLSNQRQIALSTANILIKITIYLYFFLLYYYSEKDYKKKTAYSIFLGVSVFCCIYYIIAFFYWECDKIDMGNPFTLCELKEKLKLDDKVIEILTKNDQIDAIYYGKSFSSMFYRGRMIIMVPEKAVDYNGVILHELKHCLIRKENFYYIVRYNIFYIFLAIFGAFILFYYTKKPSNFAKRFFIFDIFLTIFILKLILFLGNNEENYCDDFAINHGYGKNLAIYSMHDFLKNEIITSFFGTNFTNLFLDFSVHMPMINRLKKFLNIK